MRVIVRSGVFLAIVVSMALPARAQITTVTVRVDGLSCPFCAYSLEKNIKEIEGTRDPVINIEEGLVTLTPVGDAPIDYDGLRIAVMAAGFTPREIGVTGTGRIETTKERVTTLFDANGQALFTLVENEFLAGLKIDAALLVTFGGTVTPLKSDDGTLRTLTLLSAAPVEGDID